MKPHQILLTAALLLGSIFSATAADQTATWDNSTGNWSDPTKWSTNPLFPNNGNGGFTFDAVQNGGTLFRDVAITLEKFTLAGGSMEGASALTLNSTFTFTGGAINSSAPVNANGGVTINTGNDKFLGGNAVLNLNSDTAWSAGRLRYYGGTLNNGATETLTLSFDGAMVSEFSTNTFNNAGIFTKSAGAGTAAIGITTNNTGTVNANSGTLSFNGGGTSTGAWDVTSGATLGFGGGTHTFNSGSIVTGSGTGVVNVSAGSAVFNAGTSYTVAGTTLASGSGIATFNTAASTGALTILPGANVSGSGDVTVSGLFTFSGGGLTGVGAVLNANGGTTIDTGNDKFFGNGRVLNLNDNTTWSGGTIRFNAGTANNASGMTFTNSFNGTMQNDGGTNAFNNAGIFTKSGATGTTTVSIAFNNTGTVNANVGTLLFNSTAANTHTGAFAVGTGAVLEFGASSSSNLNAGTSFTGVGTTRISGGMVSVNAPVSMSTTLELTGGTIVGSGTLTVSGPMSFQTGDVGSGTIVANGGVTFSTGNDKFMGGGGDLHLGGTSTWSAGRIRLGNGATLKTLAGSTLNNTFDGELRHDFGSPVSTFENEGTFTKSGGTGTTTLTGNAGAINLNNTGTINVNSGTLAINGNVTQHSGSTLTGGTWNVNNGATLDYSAGSNITTIASGGSVMLNGAGSSFAKVTTALNNNQGSFTLKNNRDLTTAGAYTNSGTTRVEDSTTVMTVNGAYTQTGGVTAMVGGAFIDPTVFNLNGGTLQGTGTIQSNVIAGPGSNTIAPGMSPGTLTINGNLTLSSGSTLAMELGGLTQGTLYDHLDVNGVLTLAGMLDLDFINDFQNSLTNGEILTLATADSAILGSFSNVASGGHLLTNFPFALQVWYGAGSPFGAENLVVVVPEPSRAMFLMLGLFGLMQRRSRPTVRETVAG